MPGLAGPVHPRQEEPRDDHGQGRHCEEPAGVAGEQDVWDWVRADRQMTKHGYVCAGITCEGCNRVWPGEHFPFALCNFCRASPSWHHGRCCRSRQAQQARTGQQLGQAQVHATAVGAAGSADHSAAGAHVSAGAAADASSQAAASLWTSAGDETANASADFEGDEMASASSVCAGIGDHPTLSGPAANFAATQKQGTLLRGDGLSLRLRGVRGQRPC